MSKNQLTGDLEGLPKAWIKLLDSTITADEQHTNPDAAYQAVKFYNYSIKKRDNAEPFKPFITEEAINEESEEIEKFLDAKNAHNSEDSFGESSEELPEIPPPLPKKTQLPPKPQLLPKPSITPRKLTEDKRILDKNDSANNNFNYSISAINTTQTSIDVSNTNNKDTFIVNDTMNDELTLRPKESANQRTTKTDVEVYDELRKICNLDDPFARYEKTKEVGKGASGVVFIASDLFTSQQVAIKTIDLKNQSSKELILNEIRVLKDFNHKNLVNFLDAYYLEEADSSLWIVLELMSGGPLTGKFLKSKVLKVRYSLMFS